MSSPAPDVDPVLGAGSKWSARLRRSTRVGGLVALFALVCAAAGVVGGWSLATHAVAARPVHAQSVLRVPSYEGQSGVAMPDVRGLPESSARQVIVDAGIPVSVLHVEARPDAADKGIVVAQTPAFGSIGPSTVTLSVSDGAVVPSVVGTAADAATESLEQLGTRVQTVAGYDADQKTGVVLAISPKAGAVLGDSVQLTVNDAPTGRYLSTLAAVSGSCSAASSAVLGGTAAPESLQCSAGASSTPNTSTWLLQKAVDAIRGQIGVGDAEATPSKVRVRVITDRDVAFDQVVRWGAPVELDITTSGALRLTVEVSSVDDLQPVSATLGSLQLVGGTAAMNRLPAQ